MEMFEKTRQETIGINNLNLCVLVGEANRMDSAPKIMGCLLLLPEDYVWLP